VAFIVLTAALLTPAPAHAQAVALRGFADAGLTTFLARQSFTAVLGSSSGVVFGGGVEVVLSNRVFVSVGASRFQKDGSRVFVNDGQTFDLGIPTTIRITPVMLNAGYRFGGARAHLVPYAGGGIGWHRYEETSAFAQSGEDAAERFTGVQILGGVEYRVNTWLGVSGEAMFASVPNALGTDPDSASAQFGESNLGGTTIIAKVVIGR
jgi:opacity protein-like surface antigen